MLAQAPAIPACPPEMLETRPPLDLDDEKVQRAYHETDSALLGGEDDLNNGS